MSEVVVTRRHRTIQIGLQLVIMSILTLVTVAAFTHIATMLIFRRLVMGKPKREVSEHDLQRRERLATRHPSRDEQMAARDETWSEDFFVPVRSLLHNAATVEDEVEQPDSALSRAGRSALNAVGRAWSTTRRIPSSIQRGILGDSAVTGEVYVKCYHHRTPTNPDGEGEVLLLCNPSGETVESVSSKAVALSEAIGFDSLVVFDYRPTGRSCKGILAPDTATMIEDAESVMQWLITIKGITPTKIGVAGISLGGVQAIRLAKRNPKTVSKLVLINTFASFYCMLGNVAPVLFPSAFRVGAISDFLPDLTQDVRSLETASVIVVSVEQDARVPPRCTEELLTALKDGQHPKRILHTILKGTHSEPAVDHASLEIMREFLQLPAPHFPFES